jgi:hypothetical protein
MEGSAWGADSSEIREFVDAAAARSAKGAFCWRTPHAAETLST